MSNLIPCQGGWCLSRERCGNYLFGDKSVDRPSDRLCGKEEEPETVRIYPVSITKALENACPVEAHRNQHREKR